MFNIRKTASMVAIAMLVAVAALLPSQAATANVQAANDLYCHIIELPNGDVIVWACEPGSNSDYIDEHSA